MENPKDAKHQAHGITHGDMRELQTDQVNGDVKMVSGNVDKSYKFPSHDAGFIHAEIESPEFSQADGSRLSVPKVQMYTPKEFDNHEKNNGFAGLKVTVLHNPAKGKEPIKDAVNTENKIKGATTATGTAIVSGKNGDENKPLEKLTLPELKERYNHLYAEKADETATKKELIDKINEKLNFLEEEKKAAEEAKKAAEEDAKNSNINDGIDL